MFLRGLISPRRFDSLSVAMVADTTVAATTASAQAVANRIKYWIATKWQADPAITIKCHMAWKYR